ncbi:hypothetical protein H5410_042772 [Solanum commersonii]|uniref:Pectin acetylesterase n=1 Tax=Solanum commersonii TaxID=4109 RepID=A0A9J5XWY8_SOLCO|nr:hypothetical protein H5410_042772 [Solanum commersonii]
MAGRGQGFKGKKVLLGNARCEICVYKNHVTEKCYRLVGYPFDFKSNIQSGSSGSYQNNNEGFKSTGSYNNNDNFKPYANNASALSIYFQGCSLNRPISLLNEKAIISGTSAGGLATILNCDKFKCLLPEKARVKCVVDATFFINGSAHTLFL